MENQKTKRKCYILAVKVLVWSKSGLLDESDDKDGLNTHLKITETDTHTQSGWQPGGTKGGSALACLWTCSRLYVWSVFISPKKTNPTHTLSRGQPRYEDGSDDRVQNTPWDFYFRDGALACWDGSQLCSHTSSCDCCSWQRGRG